MQSSDWLEDVLACVNEIPETDFYLRDVYAFSGRLKKLHPENNNIEAKIRQQLQLLRDQGTIIFLGRGHYRKL